MSSNEVAISVRNLSKTFRIFGHPGDRLKQAITFGVKRYHKDFIALRDVTFDIRKGETIGIIGRNGSGKSTLLQLACGILKPTSGTVQLNGRVSALLELGAGFNPEFTGRENVYFQGAVMGFSKEEMDSRIDDIAAFADIGEFLDQPVRTYSSGMFVRLAFSVAIHVDPDILIVDEALAVGDARFQSLCFSRISEIRNAGGTILFVSHATEQVVRICDRAILMDGGEILASGIPKRIVGHFQKLLYAPSDKLPQIREEIRVSLDAQPEEPLDEPTGHSRLTENEFHGLDLESYDPNLSPPSTLAYESHGAFIDSPEISTVAGKRVNFLLHGKSYRFAYTVRFDQDVTNVHFGMLIKTTEGIELGGASSAATHADRIPLVQKGTRFRIAFQFNCMLNPGTYFLNAGVTGEVNGKESILHRILDAEIFKVISPFQGTATALVDFGCESEIHPL